MTRYGRLAAGIGGAVAPFALVLAFVWLRTGDLATFTSLLGRGELCPPTAVLCVQMASLWPTHSGRPSWMRHTWVPWFLFGCACVGYTVMYADPRTGADWRLAHGSLVLFLITIVVGFGIARYADVKEET